MEPWSDHDCSWSKGVKGQNKVTQASDGPVAHRHRANPPILTHPLLARKPTLPSQISSLPWVVPMHRVIPHLFK